METKAYTETETWRKWRSSALAVLRPCEQETKPLLGLLLAATSQDNLEKMSRNPKVIRETCRPSFELLKALKAVWKEMKLRHEEWVILAALQEGLGLGIGLTQMYWEQLCQGRQIVKYDCDKWQINTDERPMCGPDEICLAAQVRYEGIGGFRIKFTGSEGKEWPVDVRFFYPGACGSAELFVTLTFEVKMFTEANVVRFRNMMPEWAVVRVMQRRFEDQTRATICYRLSLSAQEAGDSLELGEFRYASPNSKVGIGSYCWEFVRPREGFFELVRTKLRDELKLPLTGLETISV